MAGFFDYLMGNTLDKVGTFFNAPELGLSEQRAGNMPTANTGRVPLATGVANNNAATNIVTNAYNQNQGRLENMSFGSNTINNNNGGLGVGGGATDVAGGARGAMDLSSLPSAGSGGGGVNQGFLQSLMDQAAGGIQQGYDATLGILDSNRDFLKQQSQGLIGQTDTMYGQQMRGFESQRGQAQADLDRSQKDIDSNRSDALSDLTSDLRAQMDSFTRYLGAMGAADSSAAGMGQYAFGRMGQQARSTIWKEANKLSSEVGVRREKVNQLFQDNVRQLNDWKTNQLQSIQMDLSSKLQEINQAKMQADASRIAQLNDLQMQIQQQAISTALQVDQRVQSMSQANQQWAKSQASALETMKSQIDQSLQAIQFGAMDGTGLQTGVANPFSFGAGDIQTRGQQPQGFAQAILPQARRDEQTI